MDHARWTPVARYLTDEIGYAIPTNKYYLLDAHLGKLLGPDRADPLALVSAAKSDRQLRQQVINGATINESFFFRDRSLWDCLRTRLLDEIATAVSFCKELHVLMCACSRGQEIYSLSMLLAEHPAYRQIRHQIQAVDIDTTVLDQARAGCYSELEVTRGLDDERRQRYFDSDGRNYRVRADLKRNIHFAQLNLNEPFHFSRRFDLVFCRNVLIYFDPTKKTAILDRLAQYTNNHGYLILGGAESTMNLSQAWNPRTVAGTTVYEKVY